MDRQLSQLLERHAAFWKGTGEHRFEAITPFSDLEDRGGIPLADGSHAREGQEITPGSLDPGRFYPDGAGEARRGDFLIGLSPPGLCWTEAITGCPVRIVTGGAWAEPFVDQLPFEPKLREDWLEKLDEFVDLLADLAAGQVPVVQPLLRGPIDIMAAAVGHEETCLAFLEQPEASHRFIDSCVDIFIQTAKRRLSRTPLFHDGYVSSYGFWAPGQVVRTQLDNAALLSPDFYREHLLSRDRVVFEAFDFTVIHVHSCCLHIIDTLLGEPALDMIQISIDHPGGPLAGEVMPTFERIMQVKPLIVTGPVTGEELRQLRSLEPAGRLCIRVGLISEG